MRGCHMARTTLSGTSVGPGIWRKGRPGIGWRTLTNNHPVCQAGGSGLLSSTLTDMAPGVVGAAHQRAGLDVAEAELFTRGLEFLEFLGPQVTLDAQLTIRRL